MNIQWKRCIGQGMGEGHGASVPSPGPKLCPNLHVFTDLEVQASGLKRLNSFPKEASLLLMKYVEQLGSAVGKSTVKVGNVIIVILFL